MNQEKFPPGWDADRVRRLIAHYDALDEEQQVAEDEAAQEQPSQTTVVVPVEFMPAIRRCSPKKGATLPEQPRPVGGSFVFAPIVLQ